ncbi:branched-chain amino acid ABC transporter substrate-binding protein [Actinoplanes sp. GCM10030250]|uniref:branched-chain amino acid ABC transporter substrate-binding protein n=1 Tax=Actinoplanes sp. GCM10030250 TaxID=3273376 RepID=UPI003606CAD7
MRTRRVLSVTAIGAVLALLTACGADEPETPGPSADPGTIRLAALVPLTGRSSHSGDSMVHGAKMAVDEANAAGGVLGRQVELVIEDDACDPGTAVTAAHNAVKRDVAVSVGGYCSSAVVPTLKIFRNAGIPMIIAQANSTDLLEPGYDSVFLICGTVAAEAEFAVGWMKRLGGDRLAVVHDGTSFPVTLADSTAKTAKRTKKMTVVAELKLSQGAPSYARIAGAVRAAKADIVYFTGYYSEASQLIKDLRGEGFTGEIVVGDGATDGPLLQDLTAVEAKDVYGTALIFPEFMPGLAEWSGRYEKAVGSAPGPSTVEAYDSVKVALDAITRAGSLDREAIRKAIAATDFSVMSGPVTFNPDGTRTKPTFLMLRANGSAFELFSSDS